MGVYLSAQNKILQMIDDGTPTTYAGDQVNGLSPGPLALAPNGDFYLGSNEAVMKITSTDIITIASLADSLVLQGITVDSSENVYVSRLTEFDVVKIAPDGSVSIFANSSMFTLAMGIAIDSSDNIYITDQHRILKFTLAGEMGVVAGRVQGFLNALGELARFSTPWALTIGSDGNLYVVDSDNNCIRKVDLTTREVTTYAGICLTSGTTDGLATDATFQMPVAIAAAADNIFYVVDGPSRAGYRVRKIFTV
ncbi:hypothetical protein PHYSODRAFT_329412 [Phytophthora sojae]|uniref:SMP-30/Gluconolactonase/LRE-like region domain-containing protein n=1 Tax=Phytophthora sojae (strain P6497) TaxID=1094619 RepID=G4Z2P1_PHYSP|nr:hypothetical protein PHYSODRAFT_329412 [Phytophthora sojae]EGZ21470.1 hypothetical protein PHYSODRAFT_329412 [Phytophthora sojae]|eukprot:XP_009524187.1 hypothetical protein PHYSODRAFT_329412 [Phytophthora sojae]